MPHFGRPVVDRAILIRRDGWTEMRLKKAARVLVLPGFLAFWAALPACTLQKPPVYIPPEYQSPPPAGSPAPAQRGQSPSYAPAPSAPPQGPAIIKTPEFRKEELPPAPAPQSGALRQGAEPGKAEPPSPRHLASMQFVDKARSPLKRGKPDLAIPIIEQAIQSDPQNAEAFLLLARAWKQKGAKKRALEFAKKAELLYQDNPAGLKQVLVLESDLYRELGDKKKAGECHRKATRLSR